MNARARQILALGLIVILAIGIGIVARREVQRLDAAVPPESAPQVVTPAAPSASPETAARKTAAPEAGAGKTKTAEFIVPSFDIVRVEPRGDAIIAGRAAPGAEVELLSNGGVIDRTKANEAGEFVMMPPTFAQGSYELTLRTRDAGSRQAVTVAVPEAGKGEVLVVVGEPGKPSQVVQAGSPPTQTATMAPSAGTDAPPAAQQTADAEDLPLRIGAVEAEGGKLFVQGTGPDGARTQIYLNDAPLAEARVGDDGKWSLKVETGVAAGNYKVRVDQLGETGKVVARAEVPFAAAASMAPPADAPKPSDLAAATGPADAPATTGAVQSSANPIVTKLETFEVQRGDNLWRISRRIYGEGVRYSTIYEANADQIRDPNRIYPGQIFVMPPKG